MSRSRLTLALAPAAMSLVLLVGCSAPAAVDTDEPATETVGGDIPELRAPAPVLEDTAPPTPEPGQIPDGYTIVIDDEGVLSIVLPEDWSEVDGRPFTTADGREWASIIATTNSTDYPTDWEVAGLEFSGTAIGEELSEDVATAFLADIASPFDEVCEPIVTIEPYDDGLYVGWFSSYDMCGGVETAGIAVVAQDPDFNHFVFLRGKFVTEQDRSDTLEIAFSTFQSTQGLDRVSTGSRATVPSL